jgi:hypothetical protein
MSTTPPVPPLKNPSGPDKLALAAKVAAKEAQSAIQKRIGKAIFGITEKVSTQLRAYIDSYYRFVSPSMKDCGGFGFPTSVRYQPGTTDRTSDTDKPHILYFLIGSTILDYYDAVRAEVPPSMGLQKKVQLLEDIAKRGYDKFVITGTVMAGFTLVHKDEAPIPFSKDLIDGEEQSDEEQPA